jgi:hypothetical protein
MKNYLILLLILLGTNFAVGQCTSYPSTATNAAPSTTYTPCIDQTVTSVTVNSSQYILVNIVQGYTYTFSVGDVFSGANETLTAFRASDNSLLISANGTNGITLNGTAPFTDVVKILLNKGNCTATDTSVGGTIAITVNSVENNLDSQTTSGVDVWTGHIYNYVGGAAPGGSSSTTLVENSDPFINGNYAGYYNTGSDILNEGFGGSTNCFPIYSNGQIRANIYTDTFAVRYRMKSTKTGCYLINISGDDGVRLYVDGVKVFDRWIDQGTTSYQNLLVNLTGSSVLVLDYYENLGGNQVNFSMSAFSSASNTVTGPATSAVCSGTAPGLIDGSAYIYNGSTANPTINYQWQLSINGGAFATISGANGEDYSPPAITTSTQVVNSYRRIVSSTSSPTACTSISNSTSITTSPAIPAQPGTISGTATQCSSVTGQVYSVAAVTNAVRYTWTVPTGWSITAGSSSNSITVTTGTTGQNGNIAVTASNGCGTSSAQTLAVTASSPSITSASTAAAVCYSTASQSTTLAYSVISGAPTTYSIVWNAAPTNNFLAVTNATLAASPIPIVVPANTTAGTYTGTLTVRNGNGCVSNSQTFTVTVNATPTITGQPQGLSLCEGGSGTFVVTTSSSSPTYQWQYSTNSSGPWANTDGAPGATGHNLSTLSITNVPTAYSGYYVRCIITSAGCSVISNSALLTVRPTPSASISGSSTVCQNDATPLITFTNPQSLPVTVSYNINGGTTNTLNINSSSTATVSAPTNVAGTFTYNLTNVSYQSAPSCSTAITGKSATITVNPSVANNKLVFTNGTSGQLNQTPAENSNAVFTAPSGTYFATVNFASYGTPTGSSPNFLIGSCHSNASQSKSEEYLLGKNAATIPATNGVFGDPCVGTYKALYVLTSYAEPVCSGGTANIVGSTPSGGTGTYSYLWQSSTTSSTSGFADAPGTNNSINYTTGSLTQDTWYRRVVTSCSSSNTSVVVLVKVNPIITNNNVSTGQTICTGTAPATLVGSTPSGGNGSYTYSWESSTTNSTTGFIAATGTNSTSNYSPGPLTVNTWYRRKVVSGTCTNYSSALAININPNNTVSAASSSPSSCANVAIASITHTTTGATGIGTPSNLPNGTTASWSANTITIGGTPTLAGTFNYSIPLTGGCGNLNATGTITVNATSVGGNVSPAQTICSNTSPANLSLSGNVGSILRWEKATDAAFTTGLVTISSTNTTLTSATIGNLTSNTYFRAVVQNSSCSIVNSNSVLITVTASPTANAGALLTAICQGQTSAAMGGSIGGSATGGIWTGGTGTWINANNPSTATYIASNNEFGNIVLTLTTTGGTCGTVASTKSLTVNATVKLNIVKTDQSCSTKGGGKLDVTLAGGLSNVRYIKLTQAYINNDAWQQVAELQAIEVYTNKNVALSANGATATASSTYLDDTANYGPLNAIDGDFSGNNFWHSYSTNVGEYILVDLASSKNLDYIRIYNRTNCCQDRGQNMLLELLDSSSQVLYSKNVDLRGTSGSNFVDVNVLDVAWSDGGTGLNRSGLTGGNYTFTVANTLGCSNSVSTSISSINTKTWDGATWSPTGPPTITDKVIFNEDYVSSSNLVACSCEIKSGKSVRFTSSNTFKVQDYVDVLGTATLIFDNNTSLVQINDLAINSGNISYTRTTNTILKTDYVYWSSPVVGATLGQIQTGTLYYSYDTAASWSGKSASSSMATGIGYIVRGAGTWFDTGNTVHSPTFIGKPANGKIPVSIAASKNNLIGNPYPSGVDADAFILANASSASGSLSNSLAGALYFWTHGSAIQLATNITDGTAGSGAYAYTSNDYHAYTLTGGTGGPGGGPTGTIAAGQAFFAPGNSTGGTAYFNNSMRLGSGGGYLDNSKFLKTTGSSKENSSSGLPILEKNRVWLNLTNSEGAYKQTLIGYITGATNDYESLYDANSFNGNAFIDFYSINSNRSLTIQGRGLPFTDKDSVPLGFKAKIAGEFKIAIDNVDGILKNQKIYLNDKVTNSIQDLTESPYIFTTEIGTFDDRFILTYTNKTLGTDDYEVVENGVVISTKQKEIKIKASANTIAQVFVYDLSGRQIYLNSKIDKSEFIINNLVSSDQVLIIKVVLDNKKLFTQKIIF